MTEQATARRRINDPEERALRGLARVVKKGLPERPVDALQQVS
jgi:hypothetical protein